MYTEDDQYGMSPDENNNQEHVEKEKKKFRNIVIIVCAAIVLIIILIVLIYFLTSKKDSLSLPVTKLSTTDWTNEIVTLSVDNQNGKIVSYSFDGGENWQDDNAIDVTENGVYSVVVKDAKGKKSKTATVIVENIDREGPSINFTDPLYIQRGSTFDLKSGANIEDSGSGLKEYITEPNIIDTSSDQELKVLYKAFDNLGNVTEKERTVIVRNLIVKTYYRSRPITTEKYNCDPYKCSCTSCSSATQTANVSCPSGYTVTGSKCKSNEVIPAGLACPANYYLDGEICRAYKDYSIRNNCANGFKVSDNGMYCEITASSTKKTYSFPANRCPSGWTKDGKTCILKQTKINPIYNCAYTGGVLDTAKKKCRFEKITTCSDSDYPNLRGTKCYDKDNKYYIEANKVCPSGTSADGSYCYKNASITCPMNSTRNSSTGLCEQVVASVLISSKKHDESIYTCTNLKTSLNGTGCSARYILVNEKYCPAGYRDDGTKCISDTNKAATYGCPTGYTKSGDNCINNSTIPATITCPSGYKLSSGTTCKSAATSGTCCKTCYKSCTRPSYGEWSDWTLTKITPTSKLQVETKVE